MKSQIHVGLEIGTSKICVVVGEIRGDGAIKILGVGQAPSKRVRKGEIVDYEVAQTCLHDALVRAEDRSDVMIRSVFLAITGSHIASFNNRGCIRIPDDQNEIAEEDLDEVKEIARDVSIPDENIFLHSIIQHYYVDGQEKVLNPVGMLGNKLEADYHIVHGIRNRIQNTIRCVREIPLEVEDVVFSPIATAQVLLNQESKSQGALVLDIGGGTTDYILYTDGVIMQSGCVAIGGDHITNDLSVVLRLPISKAEKLKIEHGSCDYKNCPPDKIVRLPEENGFIGKDIKSSVINEIIHMRIREILELVKKRLLQNGSLDRVGSGLYLAGGCSLLPGIEQMAEEIFSMPVHRRNAAPMSGITATFENPRYATAIGLIRYAQLLDSEYTPKSPMKKVSQMFGELFGVGR